MPLRSVNDSLYIIALQEDPDTNLKSIGEKLGVSEYTVSRRLKYLRQEGTFRIHSDLDQEALGKEIVTFVITTPDLEQVQLLEKVSDLHPYTIFRSRILGHSSGVILQFSIPQGTLDSLIELFNQLQTVGYLESYEYDANFTSCHSQSRVGAWDGSTWIFDWERFRRDIEESSEALPSISKVSSQEVQKNLVGISKDDLLLLSELDRDAGQRNIEIAQAAQISTELKPYQLSRQIKFLKKKFIKGTRIFMKDQVFGFFDLFIFRCKTTTVTRNRLFNLLSANPEAFVFQSTLNFLPDGFTWHVACPSTHFSLLSQFVWDNSISVNLYLSIYQSVKTYPLWVDTFDEEQYCWRSDRQFMIEDVINALQNEGYKL